MITCFLTASFSVQIMALLEAGLTLRGIGVSGMVSLYRADIKSAGTSCPPCRLRLSSPPNIKASLCISLEPHREKWSLLA